MTRFRSVGSIASVVALVAGMLLVTVPPVAAATCEVTNAATGTTYTTLQEAVDDAASGDTLEVRGTCIGKTVIRATRLRLKGIATAEQPTPTLDGGRRSRVLKIVNAGAAVRDLTITNGRARYGAGIYTWRGRLTLKGATSVASNVARYAGGIFMYGDLVMNDTSSVSGNTGVLHAGGVAMSGDSDNLTLNDSASISGNASDGSAGGISNYGWARLNYSASVIGNTAGCDGGGIENHGQLALNDSSLVSGNTATGADAQPDTCGYGGGIANLGDTWLSDSAAVTGNTAGTAGGSIYSWGSSEVHVCSDLVRISPNDPDDPPETRPCSI